jgi:hypothetical protein
MPGPNSTPIAKTKDGRLISGKTNLKNAGLKSGENIKKDSK